MKTENRLTQEKERIPDKKIDNQENIEMEDLSIFQLFGLINELTKQHYELN